VKAIIGLSLSKPIKGQVAFDSLALTSAWFSTLLGDCTRSAARLASTPASLSSTSIFSDHVARKMAATSATADGGRGRGGGAGLRIDGRRAARAANEPASKLCAKL